VKNRLIQAGHHKCLHGEDIAWWMHKKDTVIMPDDDCKGWMMTASKKKSVQPSTLEKKRFPLCA